MKILLTNDDGIMAEGLHAMARQLEKEHELIIVAPDTQQSAKSHAITLDRPLYITKIELPGITSPAYSLTGTPADCVRTGFEAVAGKDVDLVFSGINAGYNAGMDIVYSGTVSAAIEATIYNKPAVAVSTEWVHGRFKYDTAAQVAKELFDKVQDDLIDESFVLNINVPYLDYDALKGIKLCRIGGPIYDYYLVEEELDGKHIIKLNGRAKTNFDEGSDRFYLGEGYATVTPLRYDLNNPELVNRVAHWFE